MMKKLFCLILLLLIFMITSCSSSSFFKLINFYNKFDTDGYAIIEYHNQTEYQNIKEDLLNQINDLLDTLEKEFAGSDSSIDSVTKTINNNSGKDIYTDVSSDYIYVLNKGLYYHNLSNEYDLTIGALSSLWNISNQAEYCLINNSCQKPSDEEINQTKALVNSEYISIIDNSVSLTKEGMMLDFGSIAKGYAVDKINELITNYFNDNRFFIINFGGSISYSGDQTNYNKRYGDIYVTINDLDDSTKELIKIKPTKANIVSSGNMERYIIVDDVKYSHILSPITGYPINTNLLQVTIFGDTNLDSDCLSTIIYMEGLDFITNHNLDNIDYLIIDKDYNIYISKNLEYELINNNYKINII